MNVKPWLAPVLALCPIFFASACGHAVEPHTRFDGWTINPQGEKRAKIVNHYGGRNALTFNELQENLTYFSSDKCTSQHVPHDAVRKTWCDTEAKTFHTMLEGFGPR